MFYKMAAVTHCPRGMPRDGAYFRVCAVGPPHVTCDVGVTFDPEEKHLHFV